MSSGEICPYIPFACSLVWNRRSSRDEQGPKIHISFSPDWFSRRMDLDYGRRWHRDPVYRRSCFVDMAGVLNSEFPGLHLGGDPGSIRGGLSQVNTCALVAALLDQEILFSEDQWPVNRKNQLNDRSAETLETPDIYRHPVFEDLMRQADIIEEEWGLVEGELNYQGVLNTAFRLRGEGIFIDMISAPERAHRVLRVACETMITLTDAVYARQARSGVCKDYFVTSNCVVNMISENHYREFVMPYDRMLAEHYPHFGVHNCGWKVDAYAEAYSELGTLGYLDFGIQSDLSLLNKLFPSATLTAILNPDDVLGKDSTGIMNILRRLKDCLHSCRIVLGSLDGNTDSEEVLSFLRCASDVWEMPVEQLIPQPHFG